MVRRKAQKQFSWDSKALRYRDKATGRFLPRGVVKNSVEDVFRVASERLKKVSLELQGGKISVAQWQSRMRDEVKAMHTLLGAVARGGKNHMTPVEWGQIGSMTKGEYAFLNRFAEQISSGKVSVKHPLNFMDRAMSYARAGRTTFYENEKRLQKENGIKLVVRVPHSKESCPGCKEWVAKGPVPIETMPPIGGLDCITNDLCTLDYVDDKGNRFSSDVEVPEDV